MGRAERGVAMLGMLSTVSSPVDERGVRAGEACPGCPSSAAADDWRGITAGCHDPRPVHGTPEMTFRS